MTEPPQHQFDATASLILTTMQQSKFQRSSGAQSCLERGLITALDSSQISQVCTNTSPAKHAWSFSKQGRFGWQINSEKKRISFTDSYCNSSFLRRRKTCDNTFGSSSRNPFPGTTNPSPAEYDVGSTFIKRNRSCSSISAPA